MIECGNLNAEGIRGNRIYTVECGQVRAAPSRVDQIATWRRPEQPLGCQKPTRHEAGVVGSSAGREG